MSRKGMYDECGEMLHERCATRFGADTIAMEMCRSQISRINVTAAGVLAYAARHSISTERGAIAIRPKRKKNNSMTNKPINATEFRFKDYVTCLSVKAKHLVKCVSKFKESCSSSNFHVVKLVRGEMRDVDALMRMSRNFRLVHLVRDPRGVISSRKRINFFRSMSVKASNMVPEASYYCEDVIRDINMRRKLEAKYPGRILQVVYENFMTNAHDTIRNLYEFLDRPLPAEVVSFANTTRPETASAWREKLDGDVVHDIDRTCKGMYEILSENGETFNFDMN